MTGRQQGARGAVISGTNMDGFAELVRDVVVHSGLPEHAVHTRKRDVILPAFFHERLVAQRLYAGAALLVSDPERGRQHGHHRALSDATDVRTVFREFAARLVAAA